MEITLGRGLQSESDRRHANSTAALGGESEGPGPGPWQPANLLVVGNTVDGRDTDLVVSFRPAPSAAALKIPGPGIRATLSQQRIQGDRQRCWMGKRHYRDSRLDAAWLRITHPL
jgi:hypothetical protein